MIHKKKIVFLFTELSDYMLNCFSTAIEYEYEVHVVFYPVNKEAPFKLKYDVSLFKYLRSEYSNSDSLIKLINDINPGLILISGWIDKVYLKAIKTLPINKCTRIFYLI